MQYLYEIKMIITETQYNDLLIDQSTKISYVNSFFPEMGDELYPSGRYRILMDGNGIGGFGVGLIGDVPLDAGHYFPKSNREKTYPNSIYFTSGFSVDPKYHRQGIGRKVIRLIFERNPQIENIFFYILVWQGALPFWEKLGAKIILEDERDIKYMQLNRNNLR